MGEAPGSCQLRPLRDVLARDIFLMSECSKGEALRHLLFFINLLLPQKILPFSKWSLKRTEVLVPIIHWELLYHTQNQRHYRKTTT